VSPFQANTRAAQELQKFAKGKRGGRSEGTPGADADAEAAPEAAQHMKGSLGIIRGKEDRRGTGRGEAGYGDKNSPL